MEFNILLTNMLIIFIKMIDLLIHYFTNNE